MNKTLRIFFVIILLVLAFSGHWWLFLLGLLGGSFLFSLFWEAVPIAFLFDSLFAPDDLLTRGLFTVVAVVSVFGIYYVKSLLRTTVNV